MPVPFSPWTCWCTYVHLSVKSRFVVSDIRSLPPAPLPTPVNLPCVHFHPRSSSPASLSPLPLLVTLPFLPPARTRDGRTFAIGPWYRPTSTYTAYSNEPEDCSMYLGRLTGFSKLKRGDRGARASRTHRNSRIHGWNDHGLWMLLFLFCALTPIHPHSRVFFLFVFVNARFVIVSARARISSSSVPLRRLTSFSFLADRTKIVKVRRN